MKKLLAAVLGYIIILLLVLAVLVPVTFLCGGLMRLLGFTYDSPGSFLLFFVICAVCGFPLEIFSKAFPGRKFSFSSSTPPPPPSSCWSSTT